VNVRQTLQTSALLGLAIGRCRRALEAEFWDQEQQCVSEALDYIESAQSILRAALRGE
jgi:hypothetical protein